MLDMAEQAGKTDLTVAVGNREAQKRKKLLVMLG